MEGLTAGAIMLLATQAVTLAAAVVGLVLTARNHIAIQEIHVTINSRMDQMLAGSKAEGRLAEAEDHRIRAEVFSAKSPEI